jgi:hypothetical protein
MVKIRALLAHSAHAGTIFKHTKSLPLTEQILSALVSCGNKLFALKAHVITNSESIRFTHLKHVDSCGNKKQANCSRLVL